jgi:Uma2 family endonuclease
MGRSGLDKLEIYRKLGVREVWRYRRGKLTVHLLAGTRYQVAPRSAILPELDLDELVGFLDHPTTYDAIRAYRAKLR